MNNYKETEKSLKRYLKSKVKITMATVVGFLICGSMAFGETVENLMKDEEIVNNGMVIEDLEADTKKPDFKIEGSKDMILKVPKIDIKGRLDLVTKDGAGVNIEAEEITLSGKTNPNAIWIGSGEHKINADIIMSGVDDTNGQRRGRIVIQRNGSLTLSGNIYNIEEITEGTNIGGLISNQGTLKLDGTNINVEIYADKTNGKNSKIIATKENSINNVTTGSISIEDGTTKFNGNIETNKIEIKENTNGVFKSNVGIKNFTNEENKITISNSGTAVFEIGKDGENALSNSTAAVTVNGNVDFDYSNLTKDTTISLNGKDGETDVEHNLSNATYNKENDGVYKVDLNKTDNILTFTYDTEYLSEYGSEINSINNGFQVINDIVTGMVGEEKVDRANLADKVLTNNIYAETTKAAYDNTKLIEDSILSLNTETKVGEWVANGKAIYDKNEYDREGKMKDYSSELESTGLMATFEYGLSDTTSTGIAFAGVKQDLTTDNGDSDGDAFYLGLFANKTVGNNKFTAGLGYQLDKFDSTNKVFGTGDKYDSSAISAYVQAKHIAKFDGIIFEPKVKFGYTYIDQDSVKDNVFMMDSQDMNVFDAKVGLDVSKEISLSSAKLRVLAGVDFTKLYGDIDDKYVGSFYGTTGEEKVEILGANLAENTVNFTLGAEVETEGGFFYNLGATYTMGSDNTENYGANLGIGYRF